MSKKFCPLVILGSIALSGFALGQTSLFYFEAQGVAGYSTAGRGWIFYSMSQHEVMQKPSLGFDYVQRLAGAAGDWAVFALQGRLALNADGDRTFEPQLYNAYIKFKFRFADFWVGHNRPALGLASVFDTHSHLLQTLAMDGYGFDRDWGVGLGRDFAKGNWGISLTTGSGMPLRFSGNYLLAGRLALGVQNRDNYSVGVSAGLGRTLETMGYEILSVEPRLFRMAGADVSYLWNNVENRWEVWAGKRYGEDSFALFWRLGLNWLGEDRLKWEIQPVLRREAGQTVSAFSTGITWLATGDLTLRAEYTYDSATKDSRVVVQVYYYKRLVI
jgi:hypothetical protein